MICNSTLSITVLLNSLGNFLVPLVFVVKYTLIEYFEYFFKRWSIGVSLALGYLGNIFVSLKMFNEAANKIIFPEDGLSLYLIPDSFLIDPPFDKLAVFFLGLGSRSAELPEYPVFGEAVVERFLPCRGSVAGPSPVFGLFDHHSANGIKNHVSADFKKMCVLLDEDGLVSALEEMPRLVVAFVPRLSIDAV